LLKLMILPRTRAGMSREEVQAHLALVHGPMCMRHPDVSDHFRHYVHYYATDAAVDPLLGDRLLADRAALTIIEFNDMDALRASRSSIGYREAVGPDEDAFSQKQGSLFFFAEEVLLRKGPADAATRLFHLRRFADGVDPRAGSRTWSERLRLVLIQAGRHSGILGYFHNRVALADNARGEYDVIDEIGLIAGATVQPELAATLAEAEAGLFDSAATAAMVTRPKVFVG
jgi:hypothetical protein